MLIPHDCAIVFQLRTIIYLQTCYLTEFIQQHAGGLAPVGWQRQQRRDLRGKHARLEPLQGARCVCLPVILSHQVLASSCHWQWQQREPASRALVAALRRLRSRDITIAHCFAFKRRRCPPRTAPGGTNGAAGKTRCM
eukprot:361839-Chlamydomonas_euryale.AAC.7